MSTLGIYPEELNTDSLVFQCPVKTKIHCIYQRIFLKGKNNYEYLSCTDLWDNNFEVMHIDIALDKIYLVYEEIVRAKPTGNDAYVINYPSKIYYLVYG